MREYYNGVSSTDIILDVDEHVDENVDDSDADPDYCPENDKPMRIFFSSKDLVTEQTNITYDQEDNIYNATADLTLVSKPVPSDNAIITVDVPEQLENVFNANDNDLEKKNIRKRLRIPENWRKNSKKLKINSGKSYVSRMGKMHPAKQVKPACNNCIFECTRKISEECRTELFNNFYALRDKTRQRDFISKCITSLEPKQEKGRKRAINKVYHFVVNGNNIRVCKKFFTSTLDISNNAVATVVSKTNENGYVEEEKRGKHSNRVNKTKDTMIQDIVDHINSFPRIDSHYCRSRTKKQYLEGSLNLTLMHRLYKEKCAAEGKQWVKKPIYEQVFNTQFNIGFHKPKKDQCSICEAFKNNAGNPDTIVQHEAHLNDVKVSREEKEHDKNLCKEDNEIITCCYDLQAVLTLPQGDVAEFYYKLKLNTLNFTIFDLSQKQGYCYLWHEEMARRGANEITTCVYLFLKDIAKQGKKHVIFYSDNCVAQNKNKFLFSMYLYCVENLDINSITHKYLVVGHTENEGDSMHACIEKEKKRVLKSGPLYTPSQLSAVITCAKKSGNPYRVTEMHSLDFVNWKAVAEKMGKNFNVSATNNEKVKWNEVKVIKVVKSEKNTIFYKKTMSKNVEFEKIDIRHRVRSTRGDIILEPCYKGPQGISEKKKKHLVQLCDGLQIPIIYHEFFRNLKVTHNN